MSVCRTVSEIFNVKKRRDLETGGKGRSRSLKLRRSLVLFLMNTSFFQTQFRLCVNPAIFIFVNFDVSDNVIVLVQYDK